jgi:hypothetical protein
MFQEGGKCGQGKTGLPYGKMMVAMMVAGWHRFFLGSQHLQIFTVPPKTIQNQYPLVI